MRELPSSVVAAAIMGMASGHLRRPNITDGNRIFRDRARDGSPEANERIAAAQAKRARKLARSARSGDLKP